MLNRCRVILLLYRETTAKFYQQLLPLLSIMSLSISAIIFYCHYLHLPLSSSAIIFICHYLYLPLSSSVITYYYQVIQMPSSTTACIYCCSVLLLPRSTSAWFYYCHYLLYILLSSSSTGCLGNCLFLLLITWTTWHLYEVGMVSFSYSANERWQGYLIWIKTVLEYLIFDWSILCECLHWLVEDWVQP